MKTISLLVEENPAIFSSAIRADMQSIRNLERVLEVELPQDIVPFVTVFGSGDSGAVPNINAVITDTIRYREAIGLPSHYVVLDDRNDAGTVFLNTESRQGEVAWVDSHAVFSFAQGTIQPDSFDAYSSFYEWVRDCIDLVKE